MGCDSQNGEVNTPASEVNIPASSEPTKSPSVESPQQVELDETGKYVVPIASAKLYFSPDVNSVVVGEFLTKTTLEEQERSDEWIGVYITSGELRWLEPGSYEDSVLPEETLPNEAVQKQACIDIVANERKAFAEANEKYPDPTDPDGIDFSRVLQDRYAVLAFEKHAIPLTLQTKLRVACVQNQWGL